MNYHDRLKKVNAGCDDPNWTVLDSIDRPIRPLVIELNRAGLKTKFSCCGFNYDGEEEPKTHHATLSYVFFFDPTTIQGRKNFVRLRNQLEQDRKKFPQGWDIHRFHECWHLFIKNCIPDLYNKNDGLKKGIHDYESQVINIKTLTNWIKKYLPTDRLNPEITDGNQWYFDEGFDEWQVRPKNSISVRAAKMKKQMKVIQLELDL